MAKLKIMSLLLAGSVVAIASPAIATGNHGQPSCPKGQYYWDGKGQKPSGTIKNWQYGSCVTPAPTPTPTPTPVPGPWSNSNATGGNANAGSNSNSGADANADAKGYGYGTGGSVDSTNSNSTKVGIDNVGNGNGSGNKLNSDSNSNSNSDSNSKSDSNSNSNSNSGGNTLTGKQDVNLDVDTDIALGDTTVNASSSNSNKNSQSNSNTSQGNTTNVDASDRSSTTYVDKSRTIFIPPVVPSTPPSQVAIGNIIKETLACGPLQSVIRTPVVGTHRGALFGKSKVDQGMTYDLAPYTDAAGNIVDYRRVDNGDGSTSLFGHQVVMFTTVVGVSGGGNFAIGGGSGNGDWGQGGMGNSSSNTRLVTNIQLVQCEVGTLKPTIVEVPVEVPVKKIGG